MRSLLRFSMMAAMLMACAAKEDTRIYTAGAMRNAMHKGELDATIQIDTIAQAEHLFGLGPEIFLKGELLVMDGEIFTSRMLTDSTMQVKVVNAAAAPFFVYTHVTEWRKVELPDSVNNNKKLEGFLNVLRAGTKPFAFLVKGHVQDADIHVVNLPAGTVVPSPADAHQGKVNFKITNELVEVLGFFSISHKGVFTHHDSYAHMHLITTDRQKMGHVDGLVFAPMDVQLFIPNR